MEPDQPRASLRPMLPVPEGASEPAASSPQPLPAPVGTEGEAPASGLPWYAWTLLLLGGLWLLDRALSGRRENPEDGDEDWDDEDEED